MAEEGGVVVRRASRPAACDRRVALLLGTAASAAAGLLPAAAPAVAAVNDAADDDDDSSASFYSRWPYVVPADILPFIRTRARHGDAGAVLAAMDEWATHYPMYAIGAEKGALLDAVLEDLRPRSALEVGSFLGYSAVRTARQLAPDGLLVCIEANPDNAAVARAVVDHAGLGGRVVILQGLGSERLADAARVVAEAAGPSGDQGPRQQADVRGGSSSSSSERVLATLRREAARQELAAAAAAAAAGGAGGGGPADTEALQQEQREQQQQQQQQQQQVVPGARVDYLFLDHCKPCYLPDLVAAEALGLVGPGTVVAADNVVYPGAPGYLEHLEAAGCYSTVLLDAPHEVDKPWDPNWKMGMPDAVSVSLRW